MAAVDTLLSLLIVVLLRKAPSLLSGTAMVTLLLLYVWALRRHIEPFKPVEVAVIREYASQNDKHTLNPFPILTLFVFFFFLSFPLFILL